MTIVIRFTVSKETCYSVKRDLLQPSNYDHHNPFYSVKRDLLQCQKRLTTTEQL